MVAYNNKKYYIDVVETKPSSAISIIETDCEVDFAPPLDYVEPERPVQATAPKQMLGKERKKKKKEEGEGGKKEEEKEKEGESKQVYVKLVESTHLAHQHKTWCCS